MNMKELPALIDSAINDLTGEEATLALKWAIIAHMSAERTQYDKQLHFIEEILRQANGLKGVRK